MSTHFTTAFFKYTSALIVTTVAYGNISCDLCSTGVLATGPRSQFVPFTELIEAQLGNALLRPMPDTSRRLAWAGAGRHRVYEFMCETHWLRPSLRPQLQCPRYVARTQLDRLSALGLRLKSGFEYEFYLFDSAGEPVFDGPDIFSSLALSNTEADLCDLDGQLQQSGIDIESFNCEFGAGQFELVGRPTDGVRSVDDAVVTKEGVKEFFQQRGLHATFMTKSRVESSSSGLHFNHSLWHGDDNVFYDSSSDDNLSTMAGHWIAGLVKHARALTALYSPTVNCYRRLHQPWTPHMANWGIDDRDTSFRVKNIDAGGTFIENRVSSGSSNPYLVLAATVAACLDGINHNLECPPQRDTTATTLPTTLSEALDSLQADEIMVELLGREFVDWFVTIKTKTELEKLCDITTDGDLELEKQLYFTYM